MGSTFEQPERERSVTDVALNRVHRGARISDALVRASLYYGSINPTSADVAMNGGGGSGIATRNGGELRSREQIARRAWGVAQMIRACTNPANIWVATDLQNSEGELYEGTGNLTSCGSRLCPSCSARLRSRARGRARAAITGVTVPRGYYWRFVTLTAPTTAEPLLQVLRLFQSAWSLLRKRRFWAGLVSAGVKGVEFTVNEHGYHVHLHLLVLSKWIPREELRIEWTESVRAACDQLDIPMPAVNTQDGLCLCDVRLVRAKRSAASQSVALDDALQEVCKYITKSESWLAVPPLHLVEVAAVGRWPRMFELLGDARVSTAATGSGEPAAQSAATFLDTPSISDATKESEQHPNVARARPPTLLELLESCTTGEWLDILKSRLRSHQTWRRLQLLLKYPYAQFETLTGERFSFEAYKHRKDDPARLRKNASNAWGAQCPVCHSSLMHDFCYPCRITIRWIDDEEAPDLLRGATFVNTRDLARVGYL